jgi:hypothetical protein
LRPETYAVLQSKYHIAPIGMRCSEPILAPTLREIVAKRIEIYPQLFEHDERIVIPLSNMTYTATDAQAAVSYVADLACATANDMLTKLTEKPVEKGRFVHPNLRAGLQALLGILGSHIMSDQEYGQVLLLRSAATERSGSGRHPAPALERWPKVLEALILGRRNWYSSEHGAVENVLGPPHVKEYRDYFLLMHCLQSLLKDAEGCQIGELCERLRHFGYDHSRVHSGILRLLSRDTSLREGSPDDDPLVNRSFPLVVVHTLTSQATLLRDDMTVQATPWGKYHLEKLIFQLQYWKHIFYQIVLPHSVAREMDPMAIRGSGGELRQQLTRIFGYLMPIEKQWLYGVTAEELKKTGVYPVMESVREKVLLQLQQLTERV